MAAEEARLGADQKVELGLTGFTTRAPSTSTVGVTAVAGTRRAVDALLVWAMETVVTAVGGSMDSDDETRRGPYWRRRRTRASPGWW